MTAEPVSLKDLGTEGEGRIWYHPSHWYALRRALKRLKLGKDDVFIDFGSGLGRAPLVAASLDIRAAMGVELSQELVEKARANVERYRGPRRAQTVEIVQADALEYEIPNDLSVAYMFCPFTGSVFEQVLQRLLDSVERHPRVLRLVYNYPFEHNVVMSSGRAETLDVMPGQWPPRPDTPDDVIVTYLLLPIGGREALRVEAPRPTRAARRHPEWARVNDVRFKLTEPDSRR